MPSRYNVAVLGAGPGGEAAAQQGLLRGARTCLIEEKQLGGTCLNVGCIPTKAMLHASEICNQIRQSGQFGLSCGDIAIDGPAFMDRVQKVVATLVGSLDKKYQTVEAIGIGQGQFVYAPVPGGLTEFLDSADPPALGIMGMDV